MEVRLYCCEPTTHCESLGTWKTFYIALPTTYDRDFARYGHYSWLDPKPSPSYYGDKPCNHLKGYLYPSWVTGLPGKYKTTDSVTFYSNDYYGRRCKITESWTGSLNILVRNYESICISKPEYNWSERQEWRIWDYDRLKNHPERWQHLPMWDWYISKYRYADYYHGCWPSRCTWDLWNKHQGHFLMSDGTIQAPESCFSGDHMAYLEPHGVATLNLPDPKQFGEYVLRYASSLSDGHSVTDGMKSEAFRDACNQATINTDNLQNVVQLGELLRDAFGGRFIEAAQDAARVKLNPKGVAKALSGFWLAYRYSYETTKSDIKEITRKAKSCLSDQGTTGYACVGTDGGTLRCKVVYTNHRQNEVCELYKHLKRMGLALDMANTWDMIPYSFVVDWFAPIGSYISDLSSNWVSLPGYFDFHELEYSWKWTDRISTPYGEMELTSYQRWLESSPPSFEWYDGPAPSARTIIRRVFDGASLLVSRC